MSGFDDPVTIASALGLTYFPFILFKFAYTFTSIILNLLFSNSAKLSCVIVSELLGAKENLIAENKQNMR